MTQFRNLFRSYPSTISLIIIQVIVWGLVSINDTLAKYIFYLFAGANSLIWEGQLWRLVTPIFLHLTWSHLFYNIALLLLIGSFLENYWGSKFVLAQFLLTGILANLFTLFVTDELFVHFGSSSSTIGLLGGIVYLLFAEHNKFPTYLSPLVFIALSLNVVTTLAYEQVNVYGHLFGLLSGIFLSWGIYVYKKLKY